MKTTVTNAAVVPTLQKIDFVSGVRDKASAQAWGEKHGYSVVYFIANKQRAYADKLQVRVDVKAEEIEQASAELVAMAEAAL